MYIQEYFYVNIKKYRMILYTIRHCNIGYSLDFTLFTV